MPIYHGMTNNFSKLDAPFTSKSTFKIQLPTIFFGRLDFHYMRCCVQKLRYHRENNTNLKTFFVIFQMSVATCKHFDTRQLMICRQCHAAFNNFSTNIICCAYFVWVSNFTAEWMANMSPSYFCIYCYYTVVCGGAIYFYIRYRILSYIHMCCCYESAPS